ncbi:chemotaxis protein CheW [uncultured Ramlibacter sp.]|uniref:chemotaxis protein CheA n=1 Tax=uncultured Ramlibacter sp. TaxID=260755 RepID=UPI0026220D65|nr:chemotaxis protein CheW [uncultured Ramlibacter sp.]
MSQTSTDSSADAGGFDLAQFYSVFFEEAAENLASMEQLLLALDPQAPEDETLHAIFRCAHSIKGGAATFGFGELAELTHVMETLLDKLRRHELALTSAMTDTLLTAGDALTAMLQRRQGNEVDLPDVAGLTQAFVGFANGDQAAPAPAAAAAAAAAPAPVAAPGTRELELLAGPLPHASIADDLVTLFGEVGGIGKLEVAAPAPDQDPQSVRFHLTTTAADSELLDLCGFHLPREQIRITPWGGAAAVAASAPADLSTAADPGWGLYENAPGATPPVVAAAPVVKAAPKRVTGGDTTIRVSVDKVDQLINLMGELVITRAMLAQRASGLDGSAFQQLSTGLADLERTTRDLQESVMSIRMIPMSDVFNRFPRMLRDLAAKLGKQIELQTVGEATELDKSLIEKITDPLTHLVRNSVDHGIETPDERLAKGKPAAGTLTLSAQHAGGSILIQVRDDGRGLDRDRILAKARKSGMQLPDKMDDSQVFQLIFAPGFSTAEVVTDVSGRGVGMDVVKRNILALGGSVDLDSAPGMGTCVSVRLPLTLAIMDGMSISVGGELYLLPLATVVESFQASTAGVKTMGEAGRVVKVRDDYLPVVALDQAFGAGFGSEPVADPMMVIVESEGQRVALEVDALVGQQQVVVKNLEANYRKVPNVSGATIMGDGRVALILDVSALVRRSRH